MPALLIDAWFMRRSLILPLLEQRVRIIGQVRRDTALSSSPNRQPQAPWTQTQVRPAIDAAVLAALPVKEWS